MTDPVNRPAHYEDGRTISPLSVLDDWSLDYYGGNMLKYLARWRRKNGRQDLEKLRWYAAHAVERWEKMDPLLRVTLSQTQQLATRHCKLDLMDIIEDWNLCREEQLFITNIYLAAFNGDPLMYKDILNLMDTWLLQRDVQEADDLLHPKLCIHVGNPCMLCGRP